MDVIPSEMCTVCMHPFSIICGSTNEKKCVMLYSSNSHGIIDLKLLSHDCSPL